MLEHPLRLRELVREPLRKDVLEATGWNNVRIDVEVGIGKGCNEGWMSDLEGEAKPLLRALVTAKRRRTTRHG